MTVFEIVAVSVSQCKIERRSLLTDFSIDFRISEIFLSTRPCTLWPLHIIYCADNFNCFMIYVYYADLIEVFLGTFSKERHPADFFYCAKPLIEVFLGAFVVYE